MEYMLGGQRGAGAEHLDPSAPAFQPHQQAWQHPTPQQTPFQFQYQPAPPPPAFPQRTVPQQAFPQPTVLQQSLPLPGPPLPGNSIQGMAGGVVDVNPYAQSSPDYIPGMPKPWLSLNAYQDLTRLGIPHLDAAMACSPFRNWAGESQAATYGVIRIDNAPYDTARNEVVSLLGRGARIVEYPSGSANYAIHVAFDRLTGKAHATFVELYSEQEAERIVRSFARYEQERRHCRKLGNRPVRAHLSTQAELMKAVFPKVKCLEWNGADPVILNPGPGESGFDSLLVEEELRSMVRLAEKPGRTQFGRESPQRVYEAMTTLLQKFPWHRQHMYTLRDRNMLFAYLLQLVENLANEIPKQGNGGRFVVQLTGRVMSELVRTACACGGFSSPQQACLVAASFQYLGENQIELHRLAPAVPFEVLSIAHGVLPQRVQRDLVDFYIICIREATGFAGALRADVEAYARNAHQGVFPGSAFGWFFCPIPFNNQLGMTMAALAEVETREFTRLLGLALEAGRKGRDTVPVVAKIPHPVA